MASVDFKKLNRQMMIYRIVQTVLVGMLVVLAIVFQGHFAAMGKPALFLRTILFSVVIQGCLIWPVYKLAWRDVSVEIEGLQPKLTPEQLAALRKKRLIGDLWKFCGVAFFVVFVALAPDAKKSIGATPVLAITIFSFLLTCLMYFQCFNFSAKKRIKQS
ncbi:MAG: hypothetical protein PHI31_04215 [Desulfuromonadaceae bacterium]|nr:hypothetical protein [Desulfuromonadaceae bacterium]